MSAAENQRRAANGFPHRPQVDVVDGALVEGVADPRIVSEAPTPARLLAGAVARHLAELDVAELAEARKVRAQRRLQGVERRKRGVEPDITGDPRKPDFEMNDPMSLMTSLRIGFPGCAASIMPINPPIDVPSQSTPSTSRRAISAAQSCT